MNLQIAKSACWVMSLALMSGMVVALPLDDAKFIDVRGYANGDGSINATEPDNVPDRRFSQSVGGILGAFGETESVNGITWEYSVADGIATITAQIGAEGEIVIPEMLGGFPVKKLGPQLFSQNTDITGVQMPNITHASYRTFFKCTNLATIEMPNIESIGEDCFYLCIALTGNQRLPKLTELGNYGFQSSGITAVYIPNMTTLNLQVFDNCANLTTVEMPAVTAIGNECFFRCPKLKNIDLHFVEYIGTNAFKELSGLTNVDLSNLRFAGAGAFRGCANIQGALYLPKLETLEHGAFVGLAIDSVNMPILTDLGKSGFYNCHSLTNVVAPRARYIRQWCFDSCTALTKVGFMPQLEMLENEAFRDNTELTNFKLAYCAQDVGEDIFMNCSKLQTIAIHAGSPLSEEWLTSGGGVTAVVTRYGGYEDVAGVRWMYDDLADGTVVVVGATGAVGDIEIPTRLNGKRVTRVETGAFEGFSGIRSIKFPYGITDVGEEAFLNCDGIESIGVLRTKSSLIASLRQEYGDDRVAVYAPSFTVITFR